jgi:hypothetical protein
MQQARDRRNEAVTDSRHRLNELLDVRRLSQNLAKVRDMDAQVGILDIAIRPHGSEQVVLLQQSSGPLNHYDEQLKCLW